ncbi:MAG: T9SS C-terminal target domain-containing protein [Calditrichaeota bacterium]|nr:MAG: T9SS C-terminal target domain-containing protein [Calditrichota bacterium]
MVFRYLLAIAVPLSFLFPHAQANFTSPETAPVVPAISSDDEISLIPENATKHVFIPTEAISSNWHSLITFDNSHWRLCEGVPGGVGYEKSSGYDHMISLDVGDEMHADGNKPNSSCFIRIPFTLTVDELDRIRFLLLEMRFDDGFVAWLNGTRVAEKNAPDSVLWNSRATADNEAGEEYLFNISENIDVLVAGENLLAVQGLNWYSRSSDFLITAELNARESIFGNFKSANLPIIVIDNLGEPIPDEPKVNARMKIIDNGPQMQNHPASRISSFDGDIAVEIRGTFSSKFPQKPYGIETRDYFGENLNVPLLGMPKENDWVLISSYNDKSFLRNILALDLFRRMGHYSPRAVLCEVFVNWEYQGIYVFAEKIKRDKNRVDIAKLKPEDTSGKSLTGGYIFKVDYYKSSGSDSWISPYSPLGHPEQKVRFVYHYPKPDDMTLEQKSYIQSFVSAAETALYSDVFADSLYGYRNFIDVASFIDYFIISELSRNPDAYRKSRYFYKEKDSDGGLLHAGPVWDFDWAWKNIDTGIFSATDGSGWVYQYIGKNRKINSPAWYVRLMQDSTFTEQLANRYFELRASLLNWAHLNSSIDSVKSYVQIAKGRHFVKWPIVAENAAPEVEPPSKSYDEEIGRLKSWIGLRLNWLDMQFAAMRPDPSTGITSKQPINSSRFTTRLFPNPASNFVYVESNKTLARLDFYNVLGRHVHKAQFSNSYSQKIALDHLSAGIYFIKMTAESGEVSRHKITILN